MAKKLNVRQSVFFHEYYSRLKNIAMSIYKWEGLPESCNARFLEQCLFDYGIAVFLEDPDLSYLNMKVAPSDRLNHYNEPIGWRAYSTEYDKCINASDCVIIRNNYMEKSTDSTIMMYAEKLARLDLTADVNINAQKTPILIRCEEKVRMSMVALYEQYNGDNPVIFGNKNLTEKPFEVLKTDAPFVVDKLREEKRAVWNEALEFLGLNTNPSDKKKERLIISEVDANNEQIDMQAETFLLCRQDAAQKINEKYGLNVTVTRRIDRKEVNVDGKIHD